MEQQKTKVSPDFFYKYIMDHDIILSKVAEKMGVSYSIVNRSFRHGIDRHGKPIYFSPSNLKKLNEAISELAVEIRNCLLKFGSDKTYTNQLGNTYDPSLVDGFRIIGKYFKLNGSKEKGLTHKVLGWNNTKNNTTLSVQKSPVYGNITREDADRINAELLSVAGYLSSIEVVADEYPIQSLTQTLSKEDGTLANTAESKKDKKGTHKHMEDTFASPAYPWEDTSLSLPERSRLYRELFPGGVLLFRVNGGYTAEGDDALLVHEIDRSIEIYTNVETGLVTAYIDSEQISNIITRLSTQEKRVMFTDMYGRE